MEICDGMNPMNVLAVLITVATLVGVSVGICASICFSKRGG